jgi:hypothetical protein
MFYFRRRRNKIAVDAIEGCLGATPLTGGPAAAGVGIDAEHA